MGGATPRQIHLTPEPQGASEESAEQVTWRQARQAPARPRLLRKQAQVNALKPLKASPPLSRCVRQASADVALSQEGRARPMHPVFCYTLINKAKRPLRREAKKHVPVFAERN